MVNKSSTIEMREEQAKHSAVGTAETESPSFAEEKDGATATVGAAQGEEVNLLERMRQESGARHFQPLFHDDLQSYLEKIVESGDKTWVLVMINMDGLKKLNSQSHSVGDAGIRQLDLTIKQVCNQNTNRLQAFKDSGGGGTSGGAGDRFGVLMHCKNGPKFAIKATEKIIKNVKASNTFTISAGISYVVKINKKDGAINIYNRAIESLSIAKKNGGDQYYWDKQFI